MLDLPRSMMDMTPTQDSSRLVLSCVWTVKEKRNGLWVPVLRRKNLFTNYGLSALASALGGGYTPPLYLTLDGSCTYMQASVAAGVTSIQTQGPIDQIGDTQLVLSAGLSTQEIVTFTSKAGSGPVTYTLQNATVYAHNAGEVVARQVNVNDTTSSILSPIQYDSVNAPGQWPQASAGYSSGTGNWIAQFYLTGTQALANIITIGLTDSQYIGSGNLHNHVILAYNHTSANDLEIDGNLTLTNA